nr:hypothetical protein [uncultured Campylobacter sp.]
MSRPALLIKFTLMIMLSVSFIDADDTNNTTMPWKLNSILSKVRDRNITRKSDFNMTLGITTFNGKSVYFWQIDQNATLKKEFEEHLAKERDFCTDFYDDLFKWKNLSAIRPVVNDSIDYNDPALKQNMGDCWYMDMNRTVRMEYRGRGFTLYKIGDHRLLYIMFYKDREYNVSNDSARNLAYILDIKDCAKSIKDPDYSPYWSRLDLEDFRNYVDGIYFTPIIYKSKYYTLNMYRDVYRNKYKGFGFTIILNDISDNISKARCGISYLITNKQ